MDKNTIEQFKRQARIFRKKAHGCTLEDEDLRELLIYLLQQFPKRKE